LAEVSKSVDSIKLGKVVVGTEVDMQTQLKNLGWRSLGADIVLLGLVLGPIAAPFLAKSGLLLLPGIAQIIYFMGEHVCPQPEMGLRLAPPWMMAVCMRCYGTVLGLLLTRLLYAADRGQSPYWLNQYRVPGILLALLLMLFYPAELWAQYGGWWGYNNYWVFPFGGVAGLGLGLLIMPWLQSPGSAGPPGSASQMLLHDRN
jgi:uncharacterized membrane protein